MQTLYTCSLKHLKSGPVRVLSAVEPGRFVKDVGTFLTESDVSNLSFPLQKMFEGHLLTETDIKILAMLLEALTGESFLEKVTNSPSEASQTGTPKQQK